MKAITLLFSVLAIAAQLASVRAGTDPLLRTHWYQDGPFARFTPDHDRVGCWSTAYAQILFFHRLSPIGRAQYECSSGRKVDVDLSQYRFDWSRFPNEITADTPKEGVDQLALYSFATAVVVRKDFGTGGYKRLLNSVEDLEAHFPVDADIHVHLGDRVPFGPAELAATMKSERITNVIDRAQIVPLLQGELAARRPVYFHFGNMRDFGHSTVIDGIRKEGERQMVHINYGAVEAERNRWYDLFAPISQPDDTTLRAFVTIRPRPTTGTR